MFTTNEIAIVPCINSAQLAAHYERFVVHWRAGYIGDLNVTSETAKRTMDQTRQVKLNRLAVVAVGTMFWTALLKSFLPSFILGHAVLLAMWIGMGSHHYARSFVDFRGALKFSILFGLALMSPAWPITYWNAHKH